MGPGVWGEQMISSEHKLKQKERAEIGACEAITDADIPFHKSSRRTGGWTLGSNGENVVVLRQPEIHPLSTPAGAVFKSLFDKVVGALILILALPLLLLVAIIVKFSSPGPTLFTQPRVGFNGREFRIFKFRTMVVHTEDEGTVTQASRSDPRVTRFGAFLRRTSLDELPQLLNVMRGEMSLVGPRPHAVAHDDYFRDRVSGYTDRYVVKPGMTGWAQVHGHRGSIESLDSMRARLEHDRWYIRNWSPLLDLKILWLTVFNLGHPNAY